MAHIRSRKHAVSYALPMTATAGLMLLSMPAHAEQAPASRALKDVVVTADDVAEPGYKADVSANPKATAALIDTPQTVTIIKEELFKQQAATNLTEALQNTAGVGTFFLGENGNTTTGDAVYLRGSDVSNSIFVDGVRDLGAISRDVFNTEQIEVLKGASGADIGRGAATGSISLVTKQPKLQDFQSGSAGVGTKYVRGTADVNMVLAPTTAFRLNLMGQDTGVAGRDKLENNRWGIAPTVGFGLGTATRIIASYQHVQQDNIPDGGVFTLGLPGYTSPDATRPFLTSAARVDSSNFYGLDNDHDKATSNSASFAVEHDLASGVVLRNFTRWSKIDQSYQLSAFMGATAQLVTRVPTDPSTWTITRNINTRDQTNAVFTNQTNLRATFKTGSFDHTVSTGFEYIREEQKNRTLAGVGTAPIVSVYAPSGAPGAFRTGPTRAYSTGATETIGLYFNDTVHLTPQLLLNGGLRLDHYKTQTLAVTAAGVATALQAKDDVFSGKGGLVYKPRPNGSIYVSYAVTKQPPGGAAFSLAAANTANANSPSVSPQSAKTYEGGTKWDLISNALSVSAAVYRTEYSDQILQDTDGTFYRAGEKSVQGVEVGAVGQITPAWGVNASFTTMKTKVKSPTNLVVTADGSTQLAYNPSSAFSAWTTYRLPIGVTVGGGVRYNGKLKRGTDGAVGTPKYVESYWVANAMASYQLTKNIDLQLNVYNLTNANYVASINKSGYRYTPDIPRSVRLTANLSF